MYYIYKFLNSNQEEIYIGITNDIKKRINQQHFLNRGHLPKECYMDTEIVVYSKCLSSNDAKIKERYLINKLNPKYNTQFKNNDTFNFEIDDFKWVYVPFDKEKYLESVKDDVNQINNELDSIPSISLKEFKTIQRGGTFLKYYKNKGTPVITIFSLNDLLDVYKIKAVKINGLLYFIYKQIEEILDPQYSSASTRIYNLIKLNHIKPEDVILIEDKTLIKDNIKSRVCNDYGYLYPTFTQLITLKGLLDYSEFRKRKNKERKFELKRVIFMEWLYSNYEKFKNIQDNNNFRIKVE